MKLISVLVPAFNEAGGLGASLTSIRAAVPAFHARGWSSELLVCDNNSTDATAAIARAHGARVVFEPVNQISRARNTAATAAVGEWLVFVDADSHPSAALFAEVADEIAAGRCMAGGSTVVMERGGRVGGAMVGAWNALSRVTRWAAGAFIFVEAAAFRAVGGFSQELYATEEIDLFRRLKRAARHAGRRIVILHRHPLVTSGRKFELYSPAEIAGFVVRTALTGGRSLHRADGCSVWYDGRR